MAWLFNPKDFSVLVKTLDTGGLPRSPGMGIVHIAVDPSIEQGYVRDTDRPELGSQHRFDKFGELYASLLQEDLRVFAEAVATIKRARGHVAPNECFLRIGIRRGQGHTVEHCECFPEEIQFWDDTKIWAAWDAHVAARKTSKDG